MCCTRDAQKLFVGAPHDTAQVAEAGCAVQRRARTSQGACSAADESFLPQSAPPCRRGCAAPNAPPSPAMAARRVHALRSHRQIAGRSSLVLPHDVTRRQDLDGLTHGSGPLSDRLNPNFTPDARNAPFWRRPPEMRPTNPVPPLRRRLAASWNDAPPAPSDE